VALFAIGVALPVVSSVLGLFDRVQHWGKVVHGVDGFVATLLFGLLLLGWRDAEAIDLSDELSAVMTTCAGIFFGVMWEIVEFVFDWITYSDLQKSNADTMTDFLWNDFAAVVAAVLATYAFCRVMGSEQRQEIGNVSVWLVDGPSRLLNRHGLLIAVLVAAIAALAVASVWFSGRPLPGLGIP
jgi:hypothetical protein